jgi:hypothetical protein
VLASFPPFAPAIIVNATSLPHRNIDGTDDFEGRLRRLRPHNTEGRTTRCAKRDAEIPDRLTVTTCSDEHLGQRVVERGTTVWALWPQRLDRGVVVDEVIRSGAGTSDKGVAKTDEVHA